METEKELFKDIVEGTNDVFLTMLMVEVEAGEPIYGRPKPVPSNLTSMLGLGGDVKGMLAIHCTTESAKLITGALLGMEVAEIDDDVKDAIGEIANMIAGNLKISFDKIDTEIVLAIPSTVIGTSYRTGGFAGATCVSVPFKFETTSFWVELKYLPNT